MRYVILLFGVWACSTAVIFVKLSSVPPIMLTSLRLLVAAVVLTPLFARDLRRHRDTFARRDLLLAIAPAICLALHFITWIIGARKTISANASLIVNLVPVVLPFILYWLIREKLNRNEFVATLISMAGLAILIVSDFQLNETHFAGDIICFGSMVLFALYLGLGRKNRHLDSVFLYVVPLYYIAGGLTLVPGILEVEHWDLFTSCEEIGYILCLGLLPTVFGHSILNYSVKHLRGQVVGVINLTQFLFAGVMAFFHPGLKEVPALSFYPAGVLLVTACVVATYRKKS